MSKLLEINHCRKQFGGNEVLTDLSLSVEEGQVLSIIGPSGSGKSTLLRCATLLETMDGGDLIYLGNYAARDTSGKSVYAAPAELRKIRGMFGLVFQNFNLFPHYSVLKNVMEAPMLVQKRQEKEVRDEALALLHEHNVAVREQLEQLAVEHMVHGGRVIGLLGLELDAQEPVRPPPAQRVQEQAHLRRVGAGAVQDPEGDVQADGGSYVTITVSVGPDMTGKVEMPKLLGMTEQEARNTLNAFGLKAGNVRTIIDSDPDNRGLVISQDVAPGTTIEEGTAVNFDIAGQQTYSYSADISAPTNSEDPDYKAGTSVHIVIVTEDGQKLLDTTTSAFPYRMGCTGITSEYGTLTMDYEVTIVETVEEEVPVTDGEIPQEGNSGTAATDGQSGTKKVTRTVERTEERTITRDLTFTPEN